MSTLKSLHAAAIAANLSIAALFLGGCAAPPSDVSPEDDPSGEENAGDDDAVGEAQEALVQAGIQYHNGPVMLGTVNVYYIWYGTWSSSAKQIFTDFASGVGGSLWWNMNTTYTNGAGTKLSNSAKFMGQYQYTSSSSYSKTLSDSDVTAIVTNTINQGKLAKDTAGIYVVLTSKDVNQVSSASSAFCSDYCGWHWSTSIGNSAIKFAWIGDPTTRCPDACNSDTVSLNGNLGVDGMVSTVAHELTEAATDPLGNAWYDASGDENADKCSDEVGPTLRASNGARYNMVLGARKFLVQQNWVNAGNGYCASSYSATDLCPNDAKKTTAGLCGCGKRDPYDVANFVDAQGYSCSSWFGFDCTQAAEQHGYTATQEAKILANCSGSCGVCPIN